MENTENKQITVVQQKQVPVLTPSEKEWVLVQRQADALSKSTLIPKDFQNNLPNCLIAFNMAKRINADPLMVMQNLYIVHGKPSFSSTFIIAAINSCGRFTGIKFRLEGTGDTLSCVAYSTEKETGDKLESPKITMEMAKKEGWVTKTGSKWQTMPELMIRYRAAAFFGRLFCPELLMGFHSVEELQDIQPQRIVIEETEAEIQEAINAAKK